MRAYIVNDGDDTVSVVETVGDTVVATPGVGSGPGPVTISPDGSKVYVGNLGTNTVSVIDAGTNNVETPITVGDDPEGVDVTADGKLLYVANGGGNTVSVVDTATKKVVATITGVGPGPGGIGDFITGCKVHGVKHKCTHQSHPHP
jgi:YVTN family beta-propeller protein